MLTAVRNTYSPAFATTANTAANTTPAGGNTAGSAPGETAATPPIGAAEPSGTRGALPTNKKGAMGKDQFLQMLTAQLKNQDPLNPMDSKDMAAQLAQFSTVEQLIQMNSTLAGQQNKDDEIVAAINKLTDAQTARADDLAQLVEGQMAMGTVGKVGVTPGDNTFVDANGNGTLVIDTGARKGTGRVTVTDASGTVVGTAQVDVTQAGQQSFELGSLFTPKLPAGKYSYKFEVATDGGQFQAVKTYTAGRITGMKYENGNPILIIGDALTVPMSKLTQIRA